MRMGLAGLASRVPAACDADIQCSGICGKFGHFVVIIQQSPGNGYAQSAPQQVLESVLLARFIIVSEYAGEIIEGNGTGIIERALGEFLYLFHGSFPGHLGNKLMDYFFRSLLARWMLAGTFFWLFVIVAVAIILAGMI